MAINYKHKRTSTASKRPTAAQLDVGEVALNYDSGTGGLFYEDSGGNIVKVGPIEVSGTAPNSSPAGSSGNSLGEMWLDTSTTPATLRVYNGTAWQETNGEASSLDGPVYFTAQANGALALGDVVYISGAAGDTPIVTKAQANSSATMPAFGFAAEPISSGSTGQITTFGSLEGDGSNPLDTSGLTVNDVVYVSATTAGGWTTTKPTGEGNLVQNIGRIQRVNSQNGVIKVGGAGRASATPNLNNGNIFIGNASNESSTASFGATLVTTLATQGIIITPTSAQFGSDVTVANGEEFRMAELVTNGTDYIAFHAPDSLTNTVTFELPDGDGTNGQVMKTDGSQVLSWADPVPGITSNTNDLTVDRHILPDTTLTYDLGSATQRFRDIYLSTNSIDLGGTVLSISGGSLLVDSDPVLTESNPSPQGDLTLPNQSDLRLGELTVNGSNYIALQAPAAVTTNTTFTLPDGDGVSGQTMITNGSGTLSFGGFGINAHASWDASAGDSFNWSTDKIAEGNITSVVRTETGKYTINFDKDFASAAYTAVCTAGDEDHAGTGSSPRAVNVVARSAGSMDIVVERTDDAVQDDDGYIAVMVIGVLA